MQITIDALEAYLLRQYGGWANEQGLFMKLVEEIGEVAEVLNKRTGRKAPDSSDLQEELGKELADVIHYAVAIAAVNGLNLNDIILQKDRQASVKYHHDINLESYILDQSRKESIDNAVEIALQYQKTHITYRPLEQTLTRKNVISPAEGGRHFPEGFFDPCTVRLSGPQASQCREAISQCLDRLPLMEKLEMLPPGASHESLFRSTDKRGRTRYYTNTHLTSGSFSVCREPVSTEFLYAFSLLRDLCEPPVDPPKPKQPAPQPGDPRFFSETVWMCKKCNAPNLMPFRTCLNCGASRGW